MKSWRLLVVLVWLLSGCASVSTLHTAETTDKGEFDHVFAFGSLKADISEVSGVEFKAEDAGKPSASYPMIEYMGRYGISEEFDVGLRTTGFVHGFDGKWNFLDKGPILMSGGVGVNYLSYSIDSASGDSKVTAIDVVPALFIDYRVNTIFRFYLVPKLVNRSVRISSQSNKFINYLGGSIGMKWGIASGVFVEYTLLKGSYIPEAGAGEEDVGLSQFAAGFFF